MSRLTTLLRGFFLCFILGLESIYAQSRVLDSIEVVSSAISDDLLIQLALNQKLTYLSHTPAGPSTNFKIRVRLDELGTQKLLNLPERENLPWRPEYGVSLRTIRFEKVTGSTGNILLEFNKSVKIESVGVSKTTELSLEVLQRVPDNAFAQVASSVVPEPEPKPLQGVDANLARVMDNAKQAMTEKNYAQAILLYETVLSFSDNRFGEEAMEYLGLARERDGQIASAENAYKNYLDKYPNGEGVGRVKQRLAGLSTARKIPKQKLREAKTPVQQASNWDVFGGFSQFYDGRAFANETDGLKVVESFITSDLDVTVRGETSDFDVRSRFSGGYALDLLSNGPGDDKRISNLFVEGTHKNTQSSFHFGRQTRNDVGGVIGRFDGLLVSVPVSDDIVLSGVTGFPVNSASEVRVETDTYFYGLSADFGTYLDAWDFETFIIQQTANGETDRRALGGEIRYFQPGVSGFALVDYDILFDELNIFLLSGQFRFSDNTNVNFNLDYRKIPILTTSNALQGQVFDSLEQLLDQVSLSTARNLAEDRTATSKSATIGFSKPIYERFQISGDFTVSKLSGTPQSIIDDGDNNITDDDIIAATSGTNTEYFYSVQLSGNSLIENGDLAILGFRFADQSTLNRYTFSLNTRYPFTRNLRINPRFIMDFRESDNGDDQFTLRPSIRTVYRIWRGFQFEADIGGEWNSTQQNGGTDRTRDFFFLLGYRIDF